MGERQMMRGGFVKLSDTLAGKEYKQFLEKHNFHLVLDEDGDSFSSTVFQNDVMLIAFTYQRGFGENIAVAEIGAPVEQSAIETRKNGWSLIGEVWKEAYQNFHRVRKEQPYPHELSREKEIALIEELLNSFISLIENKTVEIGKPKYRMSM